MVKNCCVLGCSSNTKRNPAISFFRFPTDSTLASMWLQLIGRPDFKPSQYSVICQLHFTRDDFTSGSHHYPITGIGGQRKRLKTKAIPTQNLNGCTNPEVLAEIQMRAKNTIVPHKTAKSMIANTMLNANLQKSTEAAQIQQLLTSLMPALFGGENKPILNCNSSLLNFTNGTSVPSKTTTPSSFNVTQDSLATNFAKLQGSFTTAFSAPLSSGPTSSSFTTLQGSLSSSFTNPQGDLSSPPQGGLSPCFTNPQGGISSSFTNPQGGLSPSFTNLQGGLSSSFTKPQATSYSTQRGISPTTFPTPLVSLCTSSTSPQHSPSTITDTKLTFSASTKTSAFHASSSHSSPPPCITTSLGPIISLPASLQNLPQENSALNGSPHAVSPEPVMTTPILKKEPQVEHSVFKISNATASPIITDMKNSPINIFGGSPNLNSSVMQPQVMQSPVIQTPVMQTPVMQTPVMQTPVMQTPVMQTPVMQTSVMQTPVVQTPVMRPPVMQLHEESVRGTPMECELYLELQNSLLALKQNFPVDIQNTKKTNSLLNMPHQPHIKAVSQEIPMDTGNNAYIIDVDTYQKLMETVSQKSEKCIQTEQDIKVFSLEAEIKQLKDQLYQYELAFNSLINWTEGSLKTDPGPPVLPNDNKLVEGKFVE